jgi:hypothetical protein
MNTLESQERALNNLYDVVHDANKRLDKMGITIATSVTIQKLMVGSGLVVAGAIATVVFL